MEYFIILAVLLGLYAVISNKNKEKEKPSLTPVVDVPVITTPAYSLKQVRVIMTNDFQISLDVAGDGDPDSAQDLAWSIKTMHHYDIKPLAIGCTYMEGAPTSAIPDELMALGGIEGVPTILGSDVKGMKQSALSKYIIAESKKGPLIIASGGTTGDIATAVRDGATVGNLTIVLTPGTWNADNSEGSTEYLMANVPNIRKTPTADLWHNLGVSGGNLMIKGMTPDDWIDNKRDIKMWDRANNPVILNQIRNLNTVMQDRFQKGHPLRNADWVHFWSAIGQDTGDYLHQYNVVDNGAAKMRARGL